MFQEKALMFLYCVTPVHAGTGSAIGPIDSPIQRERHNGFPTIAGSGIKGALRDHCRGEGSDSDPELAAVFGPPPDQSSEFAGACSFADAQIVLFPVRSLRKAFYYVTCPTALSAVQRLAALAGMAPSPAWPVPPLAESKYASLGNQPDGDLILEAFKFENSGVAPVEVGTWLAEKALPQAEWLRFFREKIQRDTVLVGEEEFGHFVRHSTLVEPHVRISDASGTADDGGLFYVENLPPESLLASLVMASKVRRNGKGGEAGNAAPGLRSADDVLGYLKNKLDGELVQLGGDATTGRGQVLLRLLGSEVSQ